MPHRPIIAFDGTESLEGRSLITISALYWCVAWLRQVEARLIDPSDENVILAAHAFRADTGIDLRIQDRSSTTSLMGVDLYAAMAFRSARHLRLSEAAQANISVLLALQFPAPEYLAGCVLRQHAAFDPRLFADQLHAIVKPWL